MRVVPGGVGVSEAWEADAEFVALVQKAMRLPCETCNVTSGCRCVTTSIVGRPRLLKKPHAARLNAARYRRGSDGRLRVTADPCKCGFVPTARVPPEAVQWALRYALKGIMAMHQKKHLRKHRTTDRPLVTLDGFIIEVSQ